MRRREIFFRAGTSERYCIRQVYVRRLRASTVLNESISRQKINGKDLVQHNMLVDGFSDFI